MATLFRFRQPRIKGWVVERRPVGSREVLGKVYLEGEDLPYYILMPKDALDEEFIKEAWRRKQLMERFRLA